MDTANQNQLHLLSKGTTLLPKLKEAFCASHEAAAFENEFIIDSLGTSPQLSLFVRTDDLPFRRPRFKVHFAVSTQTKLIVSYALSGVRGSDSSDARQFGPLLNKLKSEFDVKCVFADRSYWSEKNILLTESLGIDPWITPRFLNDRYKSGSALHQKYVDRWHASPDYIHYIRCHRLALESRIGVLRRELIGRDEKDVLRGIILYNLGQLGFMKLLHPDNIRLWIESLRQPLHKSA